MHQTLHTIIVLVSPTHFELIYVRSVYLISFYGVPEHEGSGTPLVKITYAGNTGI